MPKRSLTNQQKIEQLNQAVDVMLARKDGKLPGTDTNIEPLVRLAANLRELPRQSFKTRLKTELMEGRKKMSTAEMAVASQSTRTDAIPNLAFKNAAQAIEFYKKAFGAVEVFRFEAGGSIPHAEIQIGDSVFGLCDEWAEGGRFSAETWGHSPVGFRIHVKDVDSFAARAVVAGLKVTMPIRDQFYGYREGNFVDPFGYAWNIATVKEEMSVEEMHRRMQGMTTGPEGGRISEGDKGVRPIPSGHRMVTPYLVAEDGVALLEFAKQAFGAEETLRAMTPTGVHGEVRIGDSMVMMGGGVAGKKFPATLHPNALHVHVEDADAVCQKAVAAGATLIDEPRDQEYGERSGTVKDAAGNFWYIATHKGENYVPKGLHNVNPYLHPLRAEPLIGFLKRAFGAEEVAKYASPDGVVHHAQVRIGDAVLEMGEAQGKYQPMPAMFYVYVPDCDAVYRRALAAGAKSMQEPADQPYGDRNSAVTDPFGNTWYIATHVKDVTI
ncbi:MAG: VOC family protein [Candidatus Sulfotelmatobacter sp.]